MKRYEVILVLGTLRTCSTSNPTTIRELWYLAYRSMRALKRNGNHGKFIVSDCETHRTIFMLYTKEYETGYRVRLAHIGYGKSCGGYTF